MLLPDNINPKFSIYYIGSLIIKKLKEKKSQDLLDLYKEIKKENNISFSLFVLTIDWLFLVDIAKIEHKGEIILCI